MKRVIGILILVVFLGKFAYPETQTVTDSSVALPQLSLQQARKTFLKSLVLPGWGEHSLGNHRRGYGFNSAEVLCWIAYAAFQIQGKTLKENMKAYAAEHAGVYPKGKDDYYFTDIGNYMNIFEYNEQKLRNRQYESLYPENAKYYWAWDSDNSRKKFDRLRVRSSSALRNSTFAIGALVANRIISVIDVMILTKDRVEKTGPDFDATFLPLREGLELQLNLNF
ncbi:MAG: hypothetical protein WC703_01265 [Candidatus Neomarinimicrobiota bacterium]